jgi:outer membrane protein OmpU
MNKLKKIGLSALAGSLVAMSVNAAEMTVSGGAALTYSDTGGATTGNSFTMGDGLTFTASGELDNGLSVSSSYVLDNGALDDFSMTVSSDAMGSLTFHGMDGSSALGAVDDVTPNAYEESWYGGSGTGTVINGLSTTNLFEYKSPSFAGATVTYTYAQASATTSVKSVSSWGVSYSPEMVEGLTVGYATQDDESGSATTTGYTTGDADENTAYIKYVYGPITVGYQESESDSTSNSEDADSQAFGITYAVSDSLTIGYNSHTFETTGNTSLVDQESTGVTASFTSGGMTISGIVSSIDNVSGVATNDKDVVEIGVSFAF